MCSIDLLRISLPRRLRRHLGSDDAVAEPNQVLFFNKDESYWVSHPVSGGDACLSLWVDEPFGQEGKLGFGVSLVIVFDAVVDARCTSIDQERPVDVGCAVERRPASTIHLTLGLAPEAGQLYGE
jgi:hypothetical protein